MSHNHIQYAVGFQFDMFGCSCVQSFIISVGICLTISFLWTVVLPLFLKGSLKHFAKKYNASGSCWAIVTGTTSGIGLSFVRALHGLGFNVLMISRNEAALKEVQKELLAASGDSSKKKAKIEYIAIDLCQFDKSAQESVKKFMLVNKVSVLINNAGLSNDYPKQLTDCSEKECENIMAVNCQSLVSLTRLVLPEMISNKLGCVINMSSLFGSLGGPLVSVYSGSKNFVDAFSLSLNEELHGTQVRCFCSIPGFVISKMSKLKRASLTVITADSCVRTVLEQVSGNVLYYVCPHWTHSAMQWFMLSVVPQCIRLKILAYINRKTNKAALRKLARTTQ